jgi:hypothetical protein
LKLSGLGSFAAQLGGTPVTAEIAIEDRLLEGKKAEHHVRDGDALTLDEWKSVPTALANDAKVYFDKVKKLCFM